MLVASQKVPIGRVRLLTSLKRLSMALVVRSYSALSGRSTLKKVINSGRSDQSNFGEPSRANLTDRSAS